MPVLEELQQFVDTLIVIPNQNLFRMANERTTFAEAFKMADNVLYMGVRGVTDLMVKPGLVNLDFADIRTVMAEMGKAMMGTGEAEGDDRAVKAAEAAISNPLLEDACLRGARGVLINITGGYDMTLFEVDEAANRIRKEVDEDANIIFGSSVEEDLNGRLRVSVVATGIDAAASSRAAAPGRRAGARGRSAPRNPHPGSRKPPAGVRPPAGDALPGAPMAAPRRAAWRRRPDGAARPGLANGRRTLPLPLGPVAVPSTLDDPEARRAGAQVWAAERRAGRAAAPPHGRRRGLHGAGREQRHPAHLPGDDGRRADAPQPHPPAQPPLAPRRGAPTRRGLRADRGQRPPQPEEIGLDIPTFLRRQSN